MNRELVLKLKKTSREVRKIANITSKEIDVEKPESFIIKWSNVFETVVDILEIFYDKH